MAFQNSPGVNTSEFDLTTTAPAVGTSTGATAGVFRWGPADTVVQVSSEVELVEKFFEPDNNTAVSFMSAANFLSYGNDLRVVRVISSAGGINSSNNAVGPQSSTVTLTFNGTANISSNSAVVSVNTASLPASTNAGYNLLIAGDTVTVNGVSRVVSSVTNANSFIVTSNFSVSDPDISVSSGVTRQNYATIANDQEYFNGVYNSANSQAAWVARYVGALGNSLKVSVCGNTSQFATWAYSSYFDSAPTTSEYAQSITNNSSLNDELHMVVVDEDGAITGVANTVLERYSNLSKASDAKGSDGATIYYKEVIFRNSKYVHWLGHTLNSNTTSAWGNTTIQANTSGGFWSPVPANTTYSLGNGADGIPSQGNMLTAIDLFKNKEEIDISLIFSGDCFVSANSSINGREVADEYLSVASTRKDCVAFVSPSYAAAVTSSSKLNDIISYRNLLNNGDSYGVMDSGWKYQYDKYNDVYRWVPLNADIAGLCVRTDLQRDPWFSPAGVNRGQIRNLVKLSFNPAQTGIRDSLYKNGINPVVSFPGEGTILYGDKTLQNKPSAFDRINVRRLFIVLEKAISRASRASLFEINDEFTRAQFVALVEPFLRDVQGRRGIYDFRVVCDETNNTAGVLDRNEFVGDIYIKPARSVNFIQLNFVAVRSGVAFEEVVGRF